MKLYDHLTPTGSAPRSWVIAEASTWRLSSLRGYPRESRLRTLWSNASSSAGVSRCFGGTQSSLDCDPFILRLSVENGILYCIAAFLILEIWPSLIAWIARSILPSFGDDCALFGGAIASVMRVVVVQENSDPLNCLIRLIAEYVTSKVEIYLITIIYS